MMSLMVLNVPLSPRHHRDPGAREVMNFPGIYLTMTRPSSAWDRLLWLTLGWHSPLRALCELGLSQLIDRKTGPIVQKHKGCQQGKACDPQLPSTATATGPGPLPLPCVLPEPFPPHVGSPLEPLL